MSLAWGLQCGCVFVVIGGEGGARPSAPISMAIYRPPFNAPEPRLALSEADLKVRVSAAETVSRIS